MRKGTKDLTQGNILKALVSLSIPIVGTSFVQMAYNLIDLIWIGRLGSNAVAAVGTVGFYTWLGFGVILITKVGAEVGVSQSAGRKKLAEEKEFARNSLQFNITTSLIYAAMMLLFSGFLISVFNIKDNTVVVMAIKYMKIIAFGIPFFFINPVFSGIMNGRGDSRTPFLINAAGLAINILLDPLLIFGYGIVPALGVRGAAIATVFSQFSATMIFVWIFFVKHRVYKTFSLFRKPDLSYFKRIGSVGSPIGLQSAMFTIFAMILARLIAKWGAVPIAAQKIGSQIEAISWMTASGFSSAMSAFVGQNFGADKWDRIKRGYWTGMGTISMLGVIATVLFVIFPEPIFRFFIEDPETIRCGAVYLRILGYSQIFMSLEIASTGAYNGLGKTIPPSVITIFFTGLRIPAAYILSSEDILGLNGIWWSISMTTVLKGTILLLFFSVYLKQHPDKCPDNWIKQFIFRQECKALRDKRSITGK